MSLQSFYVPTELRIARKPNELSVVIGLFSCALSKHSTLRQLDMAPDSSYQCCMRLCLISCLLFGVSSDPGRGGEGEPYLC